MKTSPLKFTPTLGAAALAAFCLLSFTPNAQAKDKGGKGNSGKGQSNGNGNRGDKGR